MVKGKTETANTEDGGCKVENPFAASRMGRRERAGLGVRKPLSSITGGEI